MKKIRYIGFYDIEQYGHESRTRSIAAVNKMNYIASAAVRTGYDVEIVSPSWSANESGYYAGRRNMIANKTSLLLGPTFGTSSYLGKKGRILLSWMWLFLYLLRNVRKNDKIIFYHSIMASLPLLVARKIKRFSIILELNEIYGDVNGLTAQEKNIEKKLIDSAYAYILSTEMLISKIQKKKSFIINYGNYQNLQQNVPTINYPIDIVYAGVIDKNKAGAFNALECASFLDDKYRIRIIGFGSKEDISTLQQKIEKSNRVNKCQVFYDGLKTGVEYSAYISKCHIGLSTQSPGADYNNTSFPSKILSYLSLGLRVVTVDIPAIKNSEVAELMSFYSENSGASIAEAVLAIDISAPYDSRKRLKELDAKFVQNLANILR